MGPLHFYHGGVHLLDLFTSVFSHRWPCDEEIFLIRTYPSECVCVWASLCIEAFLLQLWPFKIICIEIPCDCGNEVTKWQGAARPLACRLPVFHIVFKRCWCSTTQDRACPPRLPSGSPPALRLFWILRGSMFSCVQKSILAVPAVYYCVFLLCIVDNWYTLMTTETV